MKRKTIDEDSSYYYYDVDISNYDLTYVVNKDGIVKVGDSIFQFKENYTKIITDGDATKISLLDRVNSTDTSMGIVVLKLNYNPVLNTIATKTVQTHGRYKTILYYDFQQILNEVDSSYICTIHGSKMRSLKKMFGLYYIDHRARMRLISSFNGNTTSGYYYDNNNVFTLTRDWTLINSIFTTSEKRAYANKYYFNTFYQPYFITITNDQMATQQNTPGLYYSHIELHNLTDNFTLILNH